MTAFKSSLLAREMIQSEDTFIAYVGESLSRLSLKRTGDNSVLSRQIYTSIYERFVTNPNQRMDGVLFESLLHLLNYSPAIRASIVMGMSKKEFRDHMLLLAQEALSFHLIPKEPSQLSFFAWEIKKVNTP